MILIILGLLGLITWLGQLYFAALGVTAVILLYLLCVLLAAYLTSFVYAMAIAILAFLLINYCFIEPRFTFQIGSAQSWLVLTVFAVIAFTVSSVMQRLKIQTLHAQNAAQQSHFFQSLAELFSNQSDPQQLLDAGCRHVVETLGITIGIVRLDQASTALEYLAGHTQAFLHMQTASVQWALDFNRPIGQGTADWPALGACILPFAFGQTEAMLVTFENQAFDLDFLKLLTHQFAQAYARLNQQKALVQAEIAASEANFKKTMLTALSHDMRTPLTAIIGAANVLRDPEIQLDRDASQRLLESIQAESYYLTQATENILTLVKLEGGADSLSLDWQLPEEIVQHVIKRYQARATSIPVIAQISCRGILLRLDAILVAHALANLIDNACHWQQVAQPVLVTMTASADWLSITVINQGPGFAPGFKITPFMSHAKHASGARGFGLGLMIVQAVMEMHQGRLELESSVSEPTCVTMRFPVIAPPQQTLDAS